MSILSLETQLMWLGSHLCIRRLLADLLILKCIRDIGYTKKSGVPHLERGVIVLAKDDGSVVGFCRALPIDDAPDDVREFLQDSQEIIADSNQMWYISELGVALSHRGRKIAYAVTERCLSEANRLGGAYYVMRTAAKGSNSRHMFLRMGSTEISEVQDVSAQT